MAAQSPAERFEADPNDTGAFESLESRAFAEADWSGLVQLYEQRLEASESTSARARADLLMRLGQVLEERCLEVDRAIECYQELARSQPEFRPPLIQLRRIYVARRQWELALQVADVEKSLPMADYERAAFCTEMGEIWRVQLDETATARDYFDQALAADPDHGGALLGLAATRETTGDLEGARECLERAIERLAGPDRAPALVALARVSASDDPARAEELYRRALTDDPRNQPALESLVASAMAKEQWELVADLQERRFNLAAGAMRRLAIAHESGRLWLGRLRNPQGARMWLRRALELFPEDPVTHFLLADAERLAGNRDALTEHLVRGCQLAGDGAPTEALRESASLAKESGDLDAAVAPLEQLMVRFPERRELASELADVLERLGRNDDLIETLERQVALSQGDRRSHAAALVELGTALEERSGDLDAATSAYERAFGVDPRSEPASRGLERLYRKAEDWTKLRLHLDAARARTTGERAAAHHAHYAELLLDRFDDPAAALEAFETALAIEPDHAGAKRGLERVALQTGDEDTLLDAYEREASVTTERGRLSFLVWEMVRLREERGEREEALLWLDRLVGADPENRRALEQLARLHEQLGQRDEGVETLERLDPLLAGPEQAENRRRIAGLRRALGENDRALDAYQRALDADPNDGKALAGLAELYEGAERWAELVEVERQRADLLDPEPRAAALSRVAELTLEMLHDADGATTILAGLAQDGLAGDAELSRLEALLEDAERYEELEECLGRRRALLQGKDADALDRRRASLLIDKLARAGDAAALLGPLHEATPDDAALRDDLERALRESNDASALTELLSLRIEEASDEEEASRLRLERAGLLESTPDHADEARATYEALASGEGEGAELAAERLDVMLERAGDWSALRERLEARVAEHPDPIAGHERLAAICRDRLDDRSGAIEHLEYAAEHEPERSDLWHALGRLYEDEQRYDDQRRAIEAEIATAPEPDRARLLHACAAAVCRDRLDDADGAEHHFARLHELDPDDLAAAEFLARRYEADERHEDLAGILEGRLGRTSAGGARGGESETALRLRLGALRAGPLDDLDGAIAVLEPATEHDTTRVLAAEPLADLYQRSGREAEYRALCRRTAAACSDPSERATWWLRLADGLREEGEDAASAEAYRQALADRPDSREARAALRDLYRRLGENDALARLLEDELARVAGRDEIPLRLELAELLVQALSRPGDGLVHLRRVLELDPDDRGAGERALALAEQLGRHDDRLAILDRLLDRERTAVGRAARLAQHGALLAGALQRPEDAAAPLRESLCLDPGQASVRRQLRAVLEGLGDWPGVLDCLAQEARQLGSGSRVSVYDEAARLAAEHLGPDAALPWLERLRAARPDDPETLARIADVHRHSDRPQPLLQALEAELALEPEDARRHALEIERADLFENQLGLPVRAAEALEVALSIDPDTPGLRERLTRLYTRADRPAALARVLETRLEDADGNERQSLHRELVRLLRGPLGDPQRAAEVLWSALPGASGGERIELLRSLGECFQQAGRGDLWARAAEAELTELDPRQPVFAERLAALRRELARGYDGPLARPGHALPHWRALLDGGGAGDLSDEAERSLLTGLRAAGEHVELARRLETRLARDPGDAGRWLELARLRAERLHRPAGAAAAYRAALDLDPGCEEALLGLRVVSERLGDWNEVARVLSLELELPAERPAPQRAALWRTLGEITWRRLDSTTGASRAFAAALEADPGDRVALRSLQSLFETMEDWRGALDFYESEIEVLGESEPDRRQQIWLRLAEIARDHLDELPRAARAFRAAAGLGDLPLPRQAEWADLHRRLEEPDRFATVFAGWCDAEGSPAAAADHLELAAALERLGRIESALARLERAVDLEPKHADAWDELVRLRESTGDLVGCGEALERSADCRAGDAASLRRHRAARLIEGEDSERALSLLLRAVDDDPARSAAHADLARLAEVAGHGERAVVAGLRMLELGAPEDEPVLAVAAALAGARAAIALERDGAAERLYAAAREIDPRNAEAVAGHAERLFARGEHAAARAALEERLTLQDDDPRRALHLAQLAACLDVLGDDDAALATYEEAIGADPDLALAQEGRVTLLEKAERIPDAITALRAWSRQAGSPAERSDRMVRAAAHEAGRDGGRDEAETLLREATETDPGCERGWLILTELLSDAGRDAEALEVATRALDALPEASACRASLCALRGRALEQRGERSEAADSFQEASRLDPDDSQSALAAARLKRGLGEWREAADGLREFVNRHRGDDAAGLARVLQQLGRLLAGPLENLEGAVEVYRRAVAADPELSGLKASLADLLSHRPEHADEALERHRELLSEDPLRQGSLRAVLRIAQTRDAQPAVVWGRALLAGLGVATQIERDSLPAKPVRPDSGEARFTDPLWEAARGLIQESARELGEALGVGTPDGSEDSASQDPMAAFRSAVVAAEGRLAAPAIVPLPDRELAEVVGLLADLAVEAENVRGEGRLVNELSRQLSRRSRKRLRRALDARGSDEVARIDFAAWRDELRGLASVEALSATQAPLRTALCAWLVAADSGREAPGPEDDITSLVAACPESRALLRRLALDWTGSLLEGNHG